ncbi:hypothetical protein NDU88_001409 [Pleurodeles waltl]|uniref:Uncharacterized protein n=1 Tax=Pleurodeles waltl TaxID=8319 RepID=A0AAV7VXI1_PLEWA|nr:hypothetical protein NDU88_001409 [Pleurodeles waltl]
MDAPGMMQRNQGRAGAASIRWVMWGNVCRTAGAESILLAGSRAASFRLGYAVIQWAVRRSSGRNASTVAISTQGAGLRHSCSTCSDFLTTMPAVCRFWQAVH